MRRSEFARRQCDRPTSARRDDVHGVDTVVHDASSLVGVVDGVDGRSRAPVVGGNAIASRSVIRNAARNAAKLRS